MLTLNKSFALIIAISALMIGCEAHVPDPLLSTKKKTYEIVKINQPKHFYVDVKEVDTGYVYKRQYVSKHCNSWRKLKIGSRWHFEEKTYQGENSTYVKIDGIKTKLCNALKDMP